MNTPKLLAHTSLAAGVVFTATAEYSLARKMGAMEAVAVMLPVAIDAYAVAALKRFPVVRHHAVAAPDGGSAGVGASARLARHAGERLARRHRLAARTRGDLAYSRPCPGRRPTPAEPVEAFNPESLPPVEVERVPEMPPALEAVVLAAEEPRTRVSAPVPDDDDELLARTRQDFHGQIPTYRDLKEKYGIGQARARRIRAVLEGDLS